MELKSKNVIYLGGFGGIGQKCLLQFLKKDIQNLAIFDLNANAALLQELRTAYSATKIFFIKVDITDTSNIEAAYREAIATMGLIDVVVNGCGLMNDRHIDLSVQINLLGLIHSTLTAVSYMDKSKGGRGGVIVNISSVAGLEPTGMFAVYSGAKAGVMAFTRALSNPLYYANMGIAFITICPGFTDTALLEAPQGKETFSYAAPIIERFHRAQRQTAEVCAHNLVKTVELAKNGSVWILDLGEIKEIEFPVYWKPTLTSPTP